jgi:hypothetical protein
MMTVRHVGLAEMMIAQVVVAVLIAMIDQVAVLVVMTIGLHVVLVVMTVGLHAVAVLIVMIALVAVRVEMMTVRHVGLVAMTTGLHAVAVLIVMIVVRAVTSTAKTHVLRLNESQMKSAAVPVDVAQPEKCRIRQSVHAKTGLMKAPHAQHVAQLAFAQRQRARLKRVAARKCVHSIPWWKSSSGPLVNEPLFAR